MRNLRVVPLKGQFIIKAKKSGFFLDQDEEFSPFNSDALAFVSESSAWNHIIRKGFLFETEVFGTIKEPFNFEERLIPLFEALKAGKPVKSITCFAGEVNKDNREKDFVINDFFAEYYFAGMASNYDGSKQFDLVDAYAGASEKKEVQFYMNWVIDFELYN